MTSKKTATYLRRKHKKRHHCELRAVSQLKPNETYRRISGGIELYPFYVTSVNLDEGTFEGYMVVSGRKIGSLLTRNFFDFGITPDENGRWHQKNRMIYDEYATRRKAA
ncbi:MAG: hypothetical protein ACE5ES_01125 [Candidatus Nanoarchaeia archaeon]